MSGAAGSELLALAALGNACAAIVLVFVTYRLFTATKSLASATADMAESTRAYVRVSTLAYEGSQTPFVFPLTPKPPEVNNADKRPASVFHLLLDTARVREQPEHLDEALPTPRAGEPIVSHAPSREKMLSFRA